MLLRSVSSLVLCLASAAVWAAGPSYRLDCLPDNATPSQVDMLQLRLELHGWQPASKQADYHLCFQNAVRQVLVTDPPPPGAPYWVPPSQHVQQIPVLRLRAERAKQPRWQAEQDLDGDDGLEGAVERLVDQLPLGID